MSSLQSSNLDVESPSVSDFYAGKSVFITGGTGFLGKVVIEKLLYSCPQIDKLYVLIRTKENLSAQERLEKFVDLPLFDRIKHENPQQLQKIVPVSGDIVLPNLGIDPEDEEILLNKVSVVIHSAATVKFNERLKTALNVNYESTRKVMDLCRRMKKIQVFIYISTAYTNSQHEVIEEKLYPTPVNVNDLYEELKHCSERDESKLLYGRPNTYILTKVLSESLVMENRGDISTVVVKPSIVTPSKSEPIEGWVDNWFGATGYLASVGRGFCRVMISRKENIMDVIPVDYVSNLIIVAGAKCHKSKDVEVFNACTSSSNPITTEEIFDMFINETVKNGYNDVPFPKLLMTRCRWVFWIISLFIEIIPAYLADFCLIQFGNPPKFIKMQRKASEVRNATEYFTKNSWLILNDRARALAASLSPHDAMLFPCDPSDISWPKYMATYFGGVKRFLIDNKLKR